MQLKMQNNRSVQVLPSNFNMTSFNLTGIVPPQPPKWKQVDHLYEDFKKFKQSCTRVFDGPMAHVTDKIKVNMLLLCGPDREDIYEGFNLPVHQQYNLELIWSLIDIANQYVTFVLRDGNSGLLPRLHLRLLIHFTIGFTSWLSNVSLNQQRESPD